MVRLSDFGKKIAPQSGIGQLMDDPGNAPAKTQEFLMLGGGNPAHIPEVQKHFRESILKLLRSEKEFGRAIGNYGRPQGNKEFIEAMRTLLRGQLTGTFFLRLWLPGLSITDSHLYQRLKKRGILVAYLITAKRTFPLANQSKPLRSAHRHATCRSPAVAGPLPAQLDRTPINR